MRAELVYDGGDLHIPSTMKAPRADQLEGTWAEKLIELAGRACYSSLGTEKSRSSLAFHRNLAGLDGTLPHYSVHEHAHFTVEVSNFAIDPWFGIPDVSVETTAAGVVRLTANLRHCLEWPNNVTYRDAGYGWPGLVKRWGAVLKNIAFLLMPGMMPSQPTTEDLWRLVEPESDTECFVSLFLEDSRVWSHEQVRHRCNISQRSGRFVDETDRADCMHPLFQEYLNECGYLALNPEDGEKLWSDPKVYLSSNEIAARTRLGNDVGSLLTQMRMVYPAVVNRLQDWLMSAKGYDKVTARKQARSAGRYYLGNCLSTEMIATASIRHWRAIFAQRCSPFADAAIRGVMGQAEKAVRASKHGHLLEAKAK